MHIQTFIRDITNLFYAPVNLEVKGIQGPDRMRMDNSISNADSCPLAVF